MPNPTITYKPRNMYERKPWRRDEIRGLIRAQGPEWATQAEIICGWHRSDDARDHCTVEWAMMGGWYEKRKEQTQGKEALPLSRFRTCSARPRTSSGRFHSLSDTDADATVDVPEDLDSAKGLQFLGFCPEVAADIWEHDCRLSGQDAAANDDVEWNRAMTDMGMDGATRRALRTPGFDNVRFRARPQHWVIETLKDRTAFLRSISNSIVHPELGRKRAVSRTGLDVDRSITPRGSPEAAGSLPHRPDEVILFKSGVEAWLALAIPPDGRLLLGAVATMRPTDFADVELLVYFTPQVECGGRMRSGPTGEIATEEQRRSSCTL
ncbi:MAG: hypothetical protein M1826_006450 [Phylliscum demangeonii]|nr:MAG: hypothetical protein M1826_006450 [Phylliscum demangeonii]